jgi:hypothetical protein
VCSDSAVRDPSVSNADDPSELEPHANTEGVGSDPSEQLEFSVDPRASRETPKERVERQDEVIASCVKACTMPLCVQACHAIADPAKLHDLVSASHRAVPLQQAASRPDDDWRSFVQKCEDTCKVDACRQMCRAAGAKEHQQAPAAVLHFDPATTDEATGDDRDVAAAAAAARGAPILPPPLPKGVHPPPEESMARMDASIGRGGSNAVETAPTQELAQVLCRQRRS